VTQVSVFCPYSIAFNSTGTRAYITSQCNSPGRVAEVDASSYKVLKMYDVGMGPVDIEITYGDTGLMVTNQMDSSASYINLVTGGITTAKLPGAPRGLSLIR
jgi:DNA-binding beta-propeller fold protein YncE